MTTGRGKVPDFEAHPETLTARPWDRLPKEGDEAWQAFVEFRDMGLGRSVQRVADILMKSADHIYSFSSRFRWRQRCEAYERQMDSHRQAEHEAVIRDMSRQQAMSAQFMWQKAIEVIRDTPTADITIRDAIAMFRCGMPLERHVKMADSPPNKPPPFDLMLRDDLDTDRALAAEEDDEEDEPPMAAAPAE